MIAPFEADLCPDTLAPRIRFNFPNGWTASILLREARPKCAEFRLASMVVCPTGRWGKGETRAIGHELTSDEVAHWLVDTAMRRAPSCAA